MNAIIALCHFCDQHGPQTLFCTQAFSYEENKVPKTSSTIDSTDSNSQPTCKVSFIIISSSMLTFPFAHQNCIHLF